MKRYNYWKYLVIILILIFMTGCGTSITTPSEPDINSFTADPLTITAGGSSTLAWDVSDATSVSIDQGVGSSLALISSAPVSPTATTTYTLTAINDAGTVTASVQVTVSTTPSEPVINSFTADPLIITTGESSTLIWDISDATSVSIDQGVGSSLALSSSAPVSPTATTTYTLTATNAAGTVTASVQVTVSTTTYTVTFDSQGGSTLSSQTVEDGGLVTEPTAPTKEGYTFGGWYKESGCISAWNFNTDTVTADVTLYAQWTPLYAIGDTGPAGGLIFYVKEDGYSDDWMYLEAAPASKEWTWKEWGSYRTLIDGTETGIGTGQSNTTTIVNWLDANEDDSEGDITEKTDRAAYLCNELVLNVYNGFFLVPFHDWFLPSKDELNLMYENLYLQGVGGFADLYYWSSSEVDYKKAWYQDFNSGICYDSYKKLNLRVRAVRAF